MKISWVIVIAVVIGVFIANVIKNLLKQVAPASVTAYLS